MRKKIIALIIAIFIATPLVKADTLINIKYGLSNANSELWYLKNLNWTNWQSRIENVNGSCNSENDCYNKAMEYYSGLNYQYYSMYVSIYPTNNEITLNITPFNLTDSDSIIQYVYTTDTLRFIFYKNSTNGVALANIVDQWHDPNTNRFYQYYDSNYNFINDGDYIFKGFYDNEGEENYNNMLQVHSGDIMPKLKDLMQYNTWGDYVNEHLEGYAEVNLDDYEYVILTLKNYNQSNAFTTNMQVKGQIGITPIYNYGQTSKDDVTGVKVQDRCNVNYENYTTYPLYILQQDLQNNAIYVVKECINNSSFKYDESIFNITYVTQENEDSPTIIINGRTYDVIPYDDLPSTATQNEEENYIPGESGSANDTGGLDSAIKDAQNKMSEIWNTITYFTDFIGQIFSSLPNEVRTILMSGFTIMIVLGIIKIFLGK